MSNKVLDIKKKFGQKVRSLRTQKGISQEDLAFKAGLDRTYISDIERGKRNVALENIEKIAKALDVTPAQLLEFTGQNP